MYIAAFRIQTLKSSVVILKKMEIDKLVEIPTKDWIELRDIFLLRWPENHVAYHTIGNYINWFRVAPKIPHLKIYSLNGTWRSDGTYVVIVSSFHWNFPIYRNC